MTCLALRQLLQSWFIMVSIQTKSKPFAHKLVQAMHLPEVVLMAQSINCNFTWTSELFYAPSAPKTTLELDTVIH